MNKSSTHYLGERGRQYFREKFTDKHAFGRLYQSRYFAPYCSERLVLLDYGAGDGTMLRNLSASRKLAVEVNESSRTRIEQLNEGLSQPLEVFEDIEEVSDNEVDLVISNHCLEHVPNPLKILIQIKRVLVAGGRLVMVTPFDDWRQRGQERWTPGNMDNHLYTWNPMNIGNLLTEAGFEVSQVRLRTTAWSPKIFWVYNWFGQGAFSLACYLFSRVTQRREVFSLARKVRE